MALDNAAADAAIDVYIALITPAPRNPTALRDAMRPLVRAIYAGIVANAVVNADGFPAMNVGGNNVTGHGRIT